MLTLFKKDPAPETNNIASVQNEQNMPQGPKTPETTDKVDSPQVEKLPNSPDVLDMLTSFQKMRTEEQELLEIKQGLLVTQQDLQSKLAKEIDKKKMPQGPKTPETTDKVDSPQVEKLPNSPDVLDMLTSFQKMRTEEQELLEIKQGLLVTQQNLQSKLAKEMDKKKMAIDELKSEIPGIQNICKQLGQVLGVDIYN